MSSIIFPLFQGTSLGAGMSDFKKEEDSFRAGRNSVKTAEYQWNQFYEAFSVANKALCAGGFAKIPLAAGRVCSFTPAILAFFIQRGFQSPAVRNSAVFIQDSLGGVCQVVAIVSAVALTAFGHQSFGIMYASMIALGFLDRNGLLPELISHPLNRYSLILFSATNLIIGDIFEKLAATVIIVNFCYTKYCALITTTAEIEAVTSAQKGLLDLPLLQKIVDGTVTLELNPHHIGLDLFPPPPKIEIQHLMRQFDQINWPRHIKAIKAKFADDDRFVQLEGAVAVHSTKQIITKVRENLQQFVLEVTERHVRNGLIQDFDRLELYLKTITAHLDKENENSRVDALLRLAVEGGKYCGPGKFHVAEELYFHRVMNCKEVSLEMKFLFSLQDLRTNFFLETYNKALMPKMQDSIFLNVFKRMHNPQDLHTFNLVVNLFAQKMGLRRASADNDVTAKVDFLTKIWATSFDPYFQRNFNAFYTESKICKHLHDTAGSRLLPKDQLFGWWYNWADRQVFENQEEQKEELSEKEKLQEGFLMGKFLNMEMEIPNPHGPEVASRFDIRFLRAMALDMGILRLKKSV